MSIRIYQNIDEIKINPPAANEVYIYQNQTKGVSQNFTWYVAVASRNATTYNNAIAGFYSKIDAVYFALTYKQIGWSTGTLVRRTCANLLKHCSQENFADYVEDLKLALDVEDAVEPRVLVVVDRAATHAFASPGIDVVIVDKDSQRDFAEDELTPIHTDFIKLLQAANIQWPVSDDGRHDEATTVA